MAASKFSFILCFDFDGTLVMPEAEIRFHPALGDMLRALRQQGAAWVINTGRSLSQTLHGLGSNGIFMQPDFIIAQECEIYKRGFIREWVDYGPWNKAARKAHERFVRNHKPFLADIKRIVQTHTKGEFLEGDRGDLGIVAHNDAELDSICEIIELHRQKEPDVGYHRNGIYLRFSHSGYSKGTALGELSRLLGLRAEHCFTAGDNYNDLSMLDVSVAKMIACPGNALPAIKSWTKKQGGFVANSTASEGMIEALQHFFTNKK
jgi:HAD superfamily hydrolase (TIGR01484 family)